MFEGTNVHYQKTLVHYNLTLVRGSCRNCIFIRTVDRIFQHGITLGGSFYANSFASQTVGMPQCLLFLTHCVTQKSEITQNCLTQPPYGADFIITNSSVSETTADTVMGGCFTKEEEINPHLSGLNDSRHVMMRRSSKIVTGDPNPAMDGSAYKPRQEHKLPVPESLAKELGDVPEEEGKEAEQPKN